MFNSSQFALLRNFSSKLTKGIGRERTSPPPSQLKVHFSKISHLNPTQSSPYGLSELDKLATPLELTFSLMRIKVKTSITVCIENAAAEFVSRKIVQISLFGLVASLGTFSLEKWYLLFIILLYSCQNFNVTTKALIVSRCGDFVHGLLATGKPFPYQGRYNMTRMRVEPETWESWSL